MDLSESVSFDNNKKITTVIHLVHAPWSTVSVKWVKMGELLRTMYHPKIRD